MKKIINVFIVAIFIFLIGCTEPVVKKYELDLSSVSDSIELSQFDISLIRIKEINGEDVKIINCDETMFTESDFQKLQTPGTHTVTVIYKLYKQEFTITLYEKQAEYNYQLDLDRISSSMDIDSFDLSLISIIKQNKETLEVFNIPCDESMLSNEDIEKLKIEGNHTIEINYEGNVFSFYIILTKQAEVTYTYELDLGYLRDEILLEDFDLSLIIIKETSSTGEVKNILCNESMISNEDIQKLKTAGNHTIVVNYKNNVLSFSVVLVEKVEVTYELDLGYLRDEVLIDDFDLNLIIIKEISSNGQVRNIPCNQNMISNEDYLKLQKAGTHVITVRYLDFSAEVTINLIDPNSGDNPTDKDTFSSTLSYYSSANGLSGTELKKALRTIISSTHKKVTTYAELKTYLQKADQDPNNSNNMLLFYTGESVTKSSNMNIWNREHVWPKSLGWFDTAGAGADMHHLRPCDPGVNSSRGNTKFGEKSGYYNASKYGVDYRGDVARIIFYMFVRYSQADSYTFTSVAESKDILLKWNKIDPVSETEIIRNDYTYTIQGNRNPFIDHPECADLIWGTTSLLNNNDNIEVYSIDIIYYIKKENEYSFI